MPRRNKNSPVYPARVSTKGIDTRPHLVEAAFITLRAGLAMFSSVRGDLVPAEPPELADINHCLRSRNSREYENTIITHASNGHALFKLIRGGLVDFSVRLKVPTDGSEPEFHRGAFNIDPQCLAPASVCLTGIEKISSNPEAVIEVLSFERDIVHGSLTEWTDFDTTVVRGVRC